MTQGDDCRRRATLAPKRTDIAARASIVVAALALLTAGNPAYATVYEASPADYRESLELLRPGDTLRLAAGEYREGLALHRLAGAPGRPIVITGPEHGAAATFVTTQSSGPAPGGEVSADCVHPSLSARCFGTGGGATGARSIV